MPILWRQEGKMSKRTFVKELVALGYHKGWAEEIWKYKPADQEVIGEDGVFPTLEAMREWGRAKLFETPRYGTQP